MWAAVFSFILGIGKWIFSRTPAIVPVAEGLGEATQQLADLKSQVKAEAAIANAEANSPSTLAGVEDRLDKGTF